MATNFLHIKQYTNPNKSTLVADTDLVMTSFATVGGFPIKFVLSGRHPSGPEFKDQWNNSPVLDGRELVDFRKDVQQETITLSLIAQSASGYAKAIALLNSWTLAVRAAQKDKNKAPPVVDYRPVYLAFNPLNLGITSYVEILALHITYPPDAWSDEKLVNFRCDNITLEFTLAPYSTATILNLVSSKAITNGASNYVQVTNDTTTYTVTNAVLTSNVATLTIGTHSLTVGDTFVAADISLDATFNGTWVVSAIAATTISFAVTHGNIASAASTGSVTPQYIKGTLSAPLRVKAKGGTSATNKLYVAVRKQGTVSNFVQWYWAKDATMTANTVARNTDTTFDGNGTTNGTRTTAADTNENKTHRWLKTTNVADQYGNFHPFLRCRSSVAGRYSARLRVGLYDGTNVVYPADGSYSTETAVLVGTDSGNALAWVDLGRIQVPAIGAGGAAVYGLVYELYVTCSNTAGSPTLDVDGLQLLPIGEGADSTGIVMAKYDLGSGASGVDAAFIDATPNMPGAYLADATPTVTFPSPQISEGRPLFVDPERAYRVYFALVDDSTSSGNPRHDHTVTNTVTIDYEIRHASEGRVV